MMPTTLYLNSEALCFISFFFLFSSSRRLPSRAERHESRSRRNGFIRMRSTQRLSRTDFDMEEKRSQLGNGGPEADESRGRWEPHDDGRSNERRREIPMRCSKYGRDQGEQDRRINRSRYVE